MAGSDNSNSGPGLDPNAVQEPGRPSELSPDIGQTVETPPLPPTGGPAPASEQQPPLPQEQPPQRTDWRDRRIGELTARTRELRAELERIKGQAPANGQAQAPGQPQGGFDQPPPNQWTIDAQIEQRAQMLAANQEFNRRCNEVAEAGRRVYPDFDLRVSKLVGLVDPNDPQGISSYNSFINAALETGEASKIIHALGGDLNEASRILSLNSVRQAVELTRLAARPMNELSGAPRPINPAATAAQAARSTTSPDDPGSDNISTEEWMRRREEQINARNVRR